MRTSILVLAILVPGVAGAQSRHGGFVGQLELGLGWCTDDACDEDNPIDAQLKSGLALGAFLGYRFPFRYLSAGFNFAFAFHPVDDEANYADDASAHSFGFDFDLRGHPLVEGPIDPWVGVGFGYAFASASWTNNLANDRDESTSVSGPTFVFSFGGDYWLSDQFALGAQVRYALLFASELCIETEWSEGIYDDDTCVEPEEWEDRDNAFYNFDEDDLPDLVQILLTGTFSP